MSEIAVTFEVHAYIPSHVFEETTETVSIGIDALLYGLEHDTVAFNRGIPADIADRMDEARAMRELRARGSVGEDRQDAPVPELRAQAGPGWLPADPNPPAAALAMAQRARSQTQGATVSQLAPSQRGKRWLSAIMRGQIRRSHAQVVGQVVQLAPARQADGHVRTWVITAGPCPVAGQQGWHSCYHDSREHAGQCQCLCGQYAPEPPAI